MTSIPPLVLPYGKCSPYSFTSGIMSRSSWEFFIGFGHCSLPHPPLVISTLFTSSKFTFVIVFVSRVGVVEVAVGVVVVAGMINTYLVLYMEHKKRSSNKRIRTKKPPYSRKN